MTSRRRSLVLLVAFAVVAATTAGALVRHQDEEGRAPELGQVDWLRDWNAAVAAAKESGKPIALLFQELAGGAAAVDFGRGPLSQPLLMEAFEDEFVPCVVLDGDAGRDGLRQRFGATARSAPVLRFVTADGADLVARRDGVVQTAAVAASLVEALAAAKRPVPAYLGNLSAELNAKRAQALFTMGCFWEGEAALGALDGVLATTAVFVPASREGGKAEEGVLVSYDPATLSRDALAAAWRGLACAERDRSDDAAAIAAARPAKELHRKHALRTAPLWKLPMTPLQQARANAAIATGKEPYASLSPRQRLLARRLDDASEFARGELAKLATPESLEGFGPYYDQVATLFTQVGHFSGG